MKMAAIIVDVPNENRRIESVWVFISEDEEGEGVCCAPLAGFPAAPLICSDEKRLSYLRQIAKGMVKLFPSKRIKLIKLTTRVDIEEIT
jgi:hypothetical protein